MRRRPPAMLLAAATLGPAIALRAPLAQAQPAPAAIACRPPDLSAAAALRLPVKPTMSNTLVFDHLALAPACPVQPLVLEVDDGGYFQVVVINTSPALFTYTIVADGSAAPEESGSAVSGEGVEAAAPLAPAAITMRHDRHFAKYRVTIAPKAGAARRNAPAGAGLPGPGIPRPAAPPSAPESEGAPLLYAVSFDVWVNTRAEWKLSVVGGVAATGLPDRRFFIRSQEAGRAGTVKTFEEDAASESHQPAEIMALANVYYSKPIARTLNAGVAFGLGTGGGTSSPKYFLGPSLVVGKYFIVTGGVVLGRVTTPPIGQALGQAPINGDNTLNTLGSKTAASWFAGIGFTWIDRADAFASALSANTASGPAAAADLDVRTIAGRYAAAKDPSDIYEVKAEGSGIAVVHGSAAVSLPVVKGRVFSNANGDKATFSVTSTRATMTLQLKGQASITVTKVPS